MTTVHLIRHGHKQSHAGDPGLTEIGIQQARQTGEYLRQFPISQIVTSPFKRTVETAQQIGEQLTLPFTTSKSLIERMNWHDDSVSRQDFIDEWIASTHDRDYQPKWGDSSRKTGGRLAEVITSLHSAEPKHIVLVTHGGAIADYLRNHFADEALTPLHKEYPEGRDYQVFNCSISTVVYTDQPELQVLNFINHLEEVTE